MWQHAPAQQQFSPHAPSQQAAMQQASEQLRTASSAIPQSEPDASEQPGVLLLNNGEVLRGKISYGQGVFEVGLPLGAIQVRASEVELCCRDIEEAYLRKRSMASPTSPAEQLELAQWCERQNLLATAGRHLERAEALAPNHPLIPLLRRRIEFAGRELVGAASTTERSTAGKAASTSASVPSADDLERMTENLPPGVMERFVREVQPLLLNYCTAAGCHGPRSSTGLSLLRIRPGSPPSRRTNQRNLHALLQWIDRQQPEASPLLTEPIRAHGTAAAPIFANHQAVHYRTIVDWVYQMASPEQPADTLADGEPKPAEDWPSSKTVFDPMVTPAQAVEAAESVPDSGQHPGKTESAEGANDGVRRAVLEVIEQHKASFPNTRDSSDDAPSGPGERPPAGFDLEAGPTAPAVGASGNAPAHSPSKRPLHPNGRLRPDIRHESDSRAPSDSFEPDNGPVDPRDRESLGLRSGRVRRGAPVPGFTPRDPFDPEIFNRRYFQAESSSAERTAEKPADNEPKSTE